MGVTEPQTDYTPQPKVAAAGIAGAVTTLVIAVLGQFHVTFSPEVAAAVTTVLAFAAGYLKKS